MGEVDWVAQNFDWTVTDQPDGVRLFQPVAGTQSPASGAADVIYAGAGNDLMLGGADNDHLDVNADLKLIHFYNKRRFNSDTPPMLP